MDSHTENQDSACNAGCGCTRALGWCTPVVCVFGATVFAAALAAIIYAFV